MLSLAAQIGPAIQVGESLVWKNDPSKVIAPNPQASTPSAPPQKAEPPPNTSDAFPMTPPVHKLPDVQRDPPAPFGGNTNLPLNPPAYEDIMSPRVPTAAPISKPQLEPL